MERGNLRVFSPDNKFTGGLSPLPDSGSTTHKGDSWKELFWCGFWFLWFWFSFSIWRQSTPKSHTLHLPSKYATSSIIAAPVQQRFAESQVHIRCRKPNPDQSQQILIGIALLQCCCSVENLLLLFKHNHRPLEVFRISTLFPCPVGSRGYETIAHLEIQAAYFSFGLPKIKVRPACFQHIKFRLIGTLQTWEEKKGLWIKAKCFAEVTKQVQRGLPIFKPLPPSFPGSSCAHMSAHWQLF